MPITITKCPRCGACPAETRCECPQAVGAGAEMLARLKRIADSGDEERLTPYVRWAVERIAELEAHRAEVTNDACGDALEKLWQEIIIARRPKYGDWEYPGQAYRHLKAEFDEQAKRIAELEGALEEIRDNPGQTYKDVLAPDDDEYSLGVRQAWQRASAYAAAVLSPAPAKAEEAQS